MKTFVENEEKNFSPKLWLSSEFNKRKSRNASYSLRAFANLINMDASTVSQILNGKRKISDNLIHKIASVIGTDPTTYEKLIKYSQKNSKKNESKKIRVSYDDESFKQLSLDAYALIADWYHYAILELTFVKDFKSDMKWIATKLSISTNEANQAVERLIRLGLLTENNGKLIKTEMFTTNFSAGVTSDALKKLQRSILLMALEAIDNTPAEEKDITSMTFAIDVEKMPEAREKIKAFRREMSHFLETGNQSRVYHLGIQLYPISKKEIGDT